MDINEIEITDTAYPRKLLTIGGNAKIVKGDKMGEYKTAILHLFPTKETCAASHIAKCAEGCLVTAGRARMWPKINQARAWRTQFYMNNMEGFYDQLRKEIESFEKHCAKRGVIPVVRLNGTSDIDHMEFIASFPQIQFYDYTKIVKRSWEAKPDNYHITLSYSGANEQYASAVMKAAMRTGTNVAFVFSQEKYKEVIRTGNYRGMTVLDGDQTDLRFAEGKQFAIIALKAKGRAKLDTSGFVVR